MKLDKRMLDRLLAMNDEQLIGVIKSIAAESGIDPAVLGINPESVQNIRLALGMATDADLQKMEEVYDSYRQNRRRD